MKTDERELKFKTCAPGIINARQSSLVAIGLKTNLRQSVHFKENVLQSTCLFSVFCPTFMRSIFNMEFNYAEHLNKQYLTANYSAPWKPLANKLAMLMRESVLIFLAACAYKDLGSRAIVDCELNSLDLI